MILHRSIILSAWCLTMSVFISLKSSSVNCMLLRHILLVCEYSVDFPLIVHLIETGMFLSSSALLLNSSIFDLKYPLFLLMAVLPSLSFSFFSFSFSGATICPVSM